MIGVISNDTASPSVWTHVAVLCYLATSAMLAFFVVKSLPYTQPVPDKERMLAPAIILALSLVFIRLLYQILVVFVHQGDFIESI